MNTSRRNLLIALSGSAAAGGALFGAGAFSTVEAERTARVEVVGDESAFLELQPIPGDDRRGEDTGDDNPYATTDDSDTLIVDVDGFDNQGSAGVNPNAVTRIPRVFEITNTGGQKVTVSVTPYDTDGETEAEITDVTFYEEEPSNDPGETNNVNTEAEDGDTIEVGIDIDTTPDTSDVEDLDTIRVKAEETEESQ